MVPRCVALHLTEREKDGERPPTAMELDENKLRALEAARTACEAFLVLGVANTDMNTAKKTYRSFMLAAHPDKLLDKFSKDSKELKRRQEIFIKVNGFWEKASENVDPSAKVAFPCSKEKVKKTVKPPSLRPTASRHRHGETHRGAPQAQDKSHSARLIHHCEERNTDRMGKYLTHESLVGTCLEKACGKKGVGKKVLKALLP
uniref:J domain-containing protein n=1 Tax=Chromera velia CCMP2878 TaxID=1169474 RepID=A0A0G4HLP7_9ALVE|eukprot:Cvel_28881.t1-p1 / transcript=Cvel_28881.t1 / gene=Cvel_28881 / organism=Chromera_velia_CCMP2878 / gene_product=hypothetical protein / transcript_product=hypothetical protein / location=Cvel_scaffold3861:6225-7577(+) / protein_length=202 / sequence_SO=supercontig / SO=protein_coding / is_pseudo=false